MWRAGKVIAIIHVEDWMEPLKTRREGRTDTQSHHSFSSCQELDSKFVEWRPWKILNTKLGRRAADASWCSARQGKAHLVKTLWMDFKHILTCFVSGIFSDSRWQAAVACVFSQIYAFSPPLRYPPSKTHARPVPHYKIFRGSQTFGRGDKLAESVSRN